ncbi:MAG: alkaline phosphatase PhoX [Gaiellaceae bacterium]
MKRKTLIPLAAVGVAAVAVSAGLASSSGPELTSVPSAQPKAVGYAPADILSPELRASVVAEGADTVENPSGVVTNYGYYNDVPSSDNPAVPQMAPAGSPATEAQKSEPDKNTYLALKGETGPGANYDYGTHFLFQGHELGVSVPGFAAWKQSSITRINLDADDAHRVTLMATHDKDGQPIAPIDGSTWDPFSQRLLFTTENTAAPTYAATATYPAIVEDVSGALGRGGYEGIQDDSDGNIWIVEDIGGSTKAGSTAAKAPNSFVYRYVPAKPGDLHDGRLQVLQVWRNGAPVTFDDQKSFPTSQAQLDLHAYGKTFATKWVTIHDTSVDGTTPFVANTLARAAGGTPFKRPENGVFRPGSKFREFFFTETGDTSSTSSENSVSGQPAGGWGGIYKLTQSSPSASSGTLSVFFSGDLAHTGLDNIQFLSKDRLLSVEDAGDTLHSQRHGLDSGYAFDVGADYSNPANQPVRIIAEGRDFAATVDSANGGFGGKNEGDNEITGIHVSNGDASVEGILGTKDPQFGSDPKWRLFWTQQHGENRTWEVTLADRQGHGGD